MVLGQEDQQFKGKSIFAGSIDEQNPINHTGTIRESINDHFEDEK